MGEMKKGDRRLRYDWKGELAAILIAAIVSLSCVLAWTYATEAQLGR